MIQKNYINKQYLFFAIPLILFLILILITYTSTFYKNTNLMSLAISIDLLLIIPIIYYILIKKTKISKLSIVPFLVIGMFVGSYIIPINNQYFLQKFEFWIFPFIELFVISSIFYKLRKTIVLQKKNKTISDDFYSLLKKTCYTIFPKKIVMFAVTEIAVFYYGFIHWKKPILKENEFSYHKNSGLIPLLILLIMVIGIETFAFHLLLLKWNSTIAWTLTILSIYSGIQLFGFLKALLKRPYKVESNLIKLHYGIMSEAVIEIDNIDEIILSITDIKMDKTTQKLSPFGTLENHNTILKLKKEICFSGFYGIHKKCKNLVLFVDDNTRFKNIITSYQNKKCL